MNSGTLENNFTLELYLYLGKMPQSLTYMTIIASGSKFPLGRHRIMDEGNAYVKVVKNKQKIRNKQTNF